MLSEKATILQALYRRTYIDQAIEFGELLRDIAVKVMGKSPIDAESYVERNEQRRWNELLQQSDADVRSGLYPIFHIPNRTVRRVQWIPSVVSPNMTIKQKRINARLRARPSIFQEIDAFSWRQYEALGCVTCLLAGATQYKLIQSGNEGGIDFFALIDLPASAHVFRGAHRPLRIVGQSKKYTTAVQADKVKEFIQTLHEIKENNPTVSKHVPPWFRTSDGPIAGWIISHNGVQSGGQSRARNHGILISDSKDIVEVAALSKKIDPSLSPKFRAGLVSNLVNEVLLQFA